MSNKITFNLFNLQGFINAKRNQQSFTMSMALQELIDNSMDAGASTVKISEVDGDLFIEDDGSGFDDLKLALVFGESSKTTGIGRYGVGMKDACIKFSNETTISSKGKSVTAEWQEMMQGGSDGSLIEGKSDSENTVVHLGGFRDRYHRNINTENISKTYAPRLSQGVLHISYNGIELKPTKKPDFTKSIDESFTFRGKNVRLTGGICNNNDPAKRDWMGYNPYYEGRLIGSGNIMNKGTGGEACNNFSFCLELSDGDEGWHLSTNKDSAEELNELMDHCYNVYTRDMMVDAAKECMDVAVKSAEDAVNDAFANEGNQTRKNKGVKRGSVKPTGKGARKTTTTTDDGAGVYKTSGRKKGSRVRFRLVHLGGASIAEVTRHADGVLIQGNLDHTHIDARKHDGEALIETAKWLYTGVETFGRTELWDGDLIDDFLDRASKQFS